MKISLYTAASAAQNAIALCVDQETGEIVMDKLKAIELAFKDRAIATVAVYKGLDHQLATLNEYEREIAHQKAVIERNKQRLHDNLKDAMKATGTLSIDSDDGLLKARLYQDRDVSVEIDADATFPPELCNPPKPPSPSKKLIRDAIERGDPVAGAHIVTKDRLEIK